MMLDKRLTKAVILGFALIVTGCGGGGGGGAANQTQSAAVTPAATTTPAASTTPAATTTSAATDADVYGDYDLAAMLVDVTDKVLIPNYTALSEAAAALSATSGIDAYCSDIGTADEATALATVKTLWQNSVDAMQTAEPHAFGPIAANDDTLRNRIHSYANVDLEECSIDQSVVAQDEASFDLSSRSTNQRGLGAIEYLLFNEVLTTQCAPQITGTASWNGLTENQRKTQRCNFASKVAIDVADAAASVLSGWSTSGDDYRATFVAEANAGASLKAITDAVIVHVDKEAKDRKVGIPTGVKAECSSFSCPSLIEFPHTETSFAAVKNNLSGFKELLTGADGKGIDDLLIARGFPEVSENLISTTNAAIANIDAATVSLFDQASATNDASTETACSNANTSPDTQSVDYSGCALEGLITQITDILKVNFVFALEVTLPGSVQSDND
jgi:predicted lipoprotein